MLCQMREFLDGTNGFLKIEKRPKMMDALVVLWIQEMKRKLKNNDDVRKDPRLSICMAASVVNTNKDTVRQILHDELNVKKVCATMVKKTSF